MTDESFILLNLKESKAKKMAQVISNETSRKILDYLATKKSATETKIAKELNIPISTVHYNLKHLKEVNLVKADEYHYSKKGKEVDHYKLSNKMVIITPKESNVESIKEKLKKILPVTLISIAGAGFIHFFSTTHTITKAAFSGAPEMLAVDAAPKAMEEAARAAPQMAMKAPPMIQQEPNLALWFLIGSLTAIVLYIAIDILTTTFARKRK